MPYAETKLSKSLTANAVDERIQKQRSESNLSRDQCRDRKPNLSRNNLRNNRISEPEFPAHTSLNQIYPKRKLKTEDTNQNMAMVKEKAGALLSKEEFSTLKFYLSEYKHANIAIKDLVRALRKMFDCEEKESLFTEIREVVNEKDLMEFDRIVYEKGKMFERVIQSQTRRIVSSSMQSLQGKQNIRNKKFASKTPLDKFKRLHYSLSSDNVLLARQHGGSQPVLNTRHLNTALNTSLPATQNTTLISPLDRRPCGPYLKREVRKERGFHNSLGNIVSEHSNSYKASSKSCEFLLDPISKYEALSSDDLDNEDIEEEEKFLNEEMKTEWIPKPRRSISLAMFRTPQVSTL